MWIEQTDQGVRVRCQIQPRASRTEIVGLHGDPPRLKVRVAAPPVEGEANEALIAFLSKRLKIPKNRFALLSGQTAKFKEILIGGARLGDVFAKLSVHADRKR